MKEPLRAPFEAVEPDLAGPRLIQESGGDHSDALPSFCMELRDARLRGGYSVADAARVLRIQEHYLKALEDGNFEDIPGTTYALGFLRSYADFLNLDPAEMVDAFKREQGRETIEQRLAFPSPSDSSPKPKFWLIILVLVLAGLAYGGWQYQSTGGQIATDIVDDVSTRLTEVVGLDAADPPGEAAVTPDAAQVATEASAPAASAPSEPLPSEPGLSASRQADPAAAAPPREDSVPTDAVPAESAATEAAAVEALPDDGASVLPAPPKADVTAAAAPAATAPAEPAVPVQPAEPAAPTGSVEAGAETAGEQPTIAAPLDLAAATVGGTGSAANAATDAAGEAAAGGDTRPGEPTEGAPAIEAGEVEASAVEEAAAVRESTPPEQAPPEPMIDVPPDDASVSAPDDAESWPPAADSDYVPKVYGRSNTDARVVVTAIDDSWVQIQGPGNELLLTRILHAGDSYRVPDRSGLVMVTGNAGGLEIRVDDTAAPKLGPLGVVLRNIALDPDRLLAGTATGG